MTIPSCCRNCPPSTSGHTFATTRCAHHARASFPAVCATAGREQLQQAPLHQLAQGFHATSQATRGSTSTPRWQHQQYNGAFLCSGKPSKRKSDADAEEEPEDEEEAVEEEEEEEEPEKPAPKKRKKAESKSKKEDDGKKKKKKKDKNAPKRGLSAYLIFSNDKREQVKADNPGVLACPSCPRRPPRAPLYAWSENLGGAQASRSPRFRRRLPSSGRSCRPKTRSRTKSVPRKTSNGTRKRWRHTKPSSPPRLAATTTMSSRAGGSTPRVPLVQLASLAWRW